MTPASHPRQLLIALLILLLIVAILGLVLFLSDREPVLESISPDTAVDGDTVILRGNNFGDERGSGSVTLAGRRLTGSQYTRWSDEEIRVRVPNFAVSGLLVVHTPGGRSEGLLLRHRDDVPVVDIEGHVRRPSVSSVSDAGVSVGDIVTIRGSRFGARRDGRTIHFAGVGATDAPVLARDDGYQHWSDTEIRVRVPDGARTGNVVLRGDGEPIDAGFVEVLSPGVTRVYGDTVRIAVEMQATVHVETVTDTSTARLWLWFPSLNARPHQPAPLVASRNGPPPLSSLEAVDVYEWTVAAPGRAGLRYSFVFERAPLSVQFQSEAVRSSYDTNAPEYLRYTAESERYGTDLSSVIQAARAVYVSGNPLGSARRAFDRTIADARFSSAGPASVSEALSEGAGNSEAISRYMVGLLRLSLVPSRVVRGVRVVDSGEMPLYSWVEFYVPGAGWIPADPAAVAGADDYFFGPTVDPSMDAGEDPHDGRSVSSNGFAEIDARRVEFNTGRQVVVRHTASGQTEFAPEGFSGSAFHVEWSDAVDGVDVQFFPPVLLVRPPQFPDPARVDQDPSEPSPE